MKKLYSKTHGHTRKNKKDEFREFVSKSLSPITSPAKVEISGREGNLDTDPNFTNTLGGETMMSKLPHNKTNFYKFSMQ